MGETDCGENWVLFWWAMLGKSLIQFSVDGQCCVPSLFFDLRSNYGGVNAYNGNLLQKVPWTHCHIQCPQTLQQATTDPCLCQRLLDTHRQVWVSLLWGHCSFLLGPGAHKVLFVPSKSLFPQSCVSSGGSMAGLMVTSSIGLMPYPGLLHPETLWQVTADLYLHRRYSNTQRQVWLSLCGV